MAFGVRHFDLAAAAVAAALAHTVALRPALTRIRRFTPTATLCYVYLPSVFIYRRRSLEKLANEWHGGPYPDFTGISPMAVDQPLAEPAPDRHRDPDGAVLLRGRRLPETRGRTCRATASRYATSTAPALARVAYFLLGLAILRRMLRQQFSDGVVLATLIRITWGTNLFHYAVFDGTLQPRVRRSSSSACWLWLVERWWERPTLACSLAIGAVAALSVLVAAHQRDLHPAAAALRPRPLAGRARAGLELRESMADARRCRAGGDPGPARRSSRSTNGSPASGS